MSKEIILVQVLDGEELTVSKSKAFTDSQKAETYFQKILKDDFKVRSKKMLNEYTEDGFYADDTHFSVLLHHITLESNDKVYILTNHAAVDCEHLGTNNRVFAKKEDAQKGFQEWKKDEMKYVNRADWKIGTDTPDHFEAYENGDYCCNHTEGFVNEYIIE